MPYEVEPPAVFEHLGFSQMNLAAACGEAYRRRYVEGEDPSVLNVPALCGSGLHEAIHLYETVYQSEINRPGFTVEEAHAKTLTGLAKDSVRQILSENDIDSETLVYYGKQDLPFYFREKIPKMAESYLVWREYEAGRTRWVSGHAQDSCEVHCRLEIAGHPFESTIDQVFYDPHDRLVIRDIKTGKAKPEHAMQIEQYRVSLARGHGLAADYGQILYINGSEPKIEVVTFSLTEREVESMIARQARSIGEGLFLVNGPFNGYCQVCDFASDCAYAGVGPRGIA